MYTQRFDRLLLKAEAPVAAEEKRVATWGSEVPDDLVLDQKRLTEALQKVKFFNSIMYCNPSVLESFSIMLSSW